MYLLVQVGYLDERPDVGNFEGIGVTTGAKRFVYKISDVQSKYINVLLYHGFLVILSRAISLNLFLHRFYLNPINQIIH